MAKQQAASVKTEPIRRGGGLLAALLLLVTTLFGLSPISPAAAADGSQVQIDKIEIDYQGEDGVIEDWRWQTVKVDWSVPGAAETPVALTIDLPEGFYGSAARLSDI